MKDQRLSFKDISPEKFPAEYFERHAMFYQNHDLNNCPICKSSSEIF